MSAGRICVRNVDTARVSENTWTAAERMHQRGVGALVVVNDTRQPIGIITDRDLVERVMAKGLNPIDTLVGDVMTAPVRTIAANTPLDHLIPMMRDGCGRRLPVVDGQGKLTGLVTLDDMLMLLARQFTYMETLLQRETPRSVAEESLAADFG